MAIHKEKIPFIPMIVIYSPPVYLGSHHLPACRCAARTIAVFLIFSSTNLSAQSCKQWHEFQNLIKRFSLPKEAKVENLRT
jgi:hypothetical protein